MQKKQVLRLRVGFIDNMIRIFDDTSIPVREMLLKGSDFLVKRVTVNSNKK